MTSLGAMRGTLAGLAEELGWEPERLSKGVGEGLAEGMVEQLEGRLAREPKNLDGWVMLIRSRMTLGEPDKAKAALEAAVKANPGSAAQLRQQAAALGVK